MDTELTVGICSTLSSIARRLANPLEDDVLDSKSNGASPLCRMLDKESSEFTQLIWKHDFKITVFGWHVELQRSGLRILYFLFLQWG